MRVDVMPRGAAGEAAAAVAGLDQCGELGAGSVAVGGEVAVGVEAGRVAGLSDRRVRYWLARYRVEGAGIYDDEAVDPGTGATAPKKRISSASGTFLTGGG